MKVTIPSSLKDITLSQYLRWLDETEKSELQNDPNLYLNIKAMEIFCNVPKDKTMGMEYSIVTTIVDRINEILNQEPKRVEFFNVGDITFGWLPKLDDMSYGEFLDLNNNISDWNNIVIAMGVLYRPVTKKYKDKYLIEEYKGDTYHDALIHMPMSAVVGSMVFFWNLGLDCLNYMMSSLDKDKQMTFQNQLTLVDAGVGTQQSMNLLAETLQNMKR
jgi:hypothetical protein